MQRECQFCDNHQQINMEEAPPGAGRKWNVTNLDGSFHKHVKYGGAATTTITSHEQQQQQKMTGDKPTTTTITENVQKAESAAGYKERQEAIGKAHDENMDAATKTIEAMKDLKESIITLSDAVYDTKQEMHEINTCIRILTNTVTAYIESTVK